jgi:outer membrane murein-binding lipoprotein Lpp
MGCATTQDVQQLENQVGDLKADIAYLKAHTEAVEASLTRIEATQAAMAVQNGQKVDATTAARPPATSIGADPGRCQAITAKGTQCTRRAQPGSKYCWQHQNYGQSQSSSTSSDRTIYTGPRGGHYYINSKGHKVYVKH